MSGQLSERQREVLAAVILNYAISGSPVGSRTVSRARPDRLSPATIRNTMSELEELGLLLQPHTSAGRVPTDSGYRYYVDAMMGEEPLSSGDNLAIQAALPAEGERPRVGELLHRTVRLLADLSCQVGVLLVPRFPQAILRRVDFHHLPGRQVLAVFVSQTGMVDHKVIAAPEPFTVEELGKMSRLVNESFHGMTLPQIRTRLIEEMHREKALYDRLLARAMGLFNSYLKERGENDDEILVDGTSNVVGESDFADIPQMKALFRAFEDKSRLVELLNVCLDHGRTQIRIGLECEDPIFRDATVITSPYRYRDEAVGALGIIGPRRMPYDRIITLVDTLSQFLSDALAMRTAAGSTGDSHDG